MNTKYFSLLAALLGAPLMATTQDKAGGDVILSMRGIGPVTLGMTVQQASAVSGTQIKNDASMGGDKYRFYANEDQYSWVGAKDGKILRSQFRILCRSGWELMLPDVAVTNAEPIGATAVTVRAHIHASSTPRGSREVETA